MEFQLRITSIIITNETFHKSISLISGWNRLHSLGIVYDCVIYIDKKLKNLAYTLQ
ncbi:protein of unknown function [Clostridium beijerinckii]|nr:protein of unknown function [Clostridium beijerinckii]